MKIPAFKNNKFALVSVAGHDCNIHEELMYDGGTVGNNSYAGYNRFGGDGELCWIEIPQDFAQLYNDWNQSLNKPRKYGVFNLSDIRVLPPEEYPNTDSHEWRLEVALWGTNGPNGDKPTEYVLLKNCDSSHLENILKNCHHISGKTIEIINSILEDRK